MACPKSSTLKSPVGNHYFNIGIAVVGLLLAIYGNFLSFSLAQKLFYFSAAVLLLLSSILERHSFFVVLEIIVLAGTGVALIPVDLLFKALVPITLSMLAIAYLLMKGEFRDYLTSIGCSGIVLLALGYAISNPIIYLLGGASLTSYSFVSYRRGVDLGLVFAILNAVFALTALVAVYHRYFL